MKLWDSCLFYINLWGSCLFYINVWGSCLFYINVWDSCLLWDSCLFYINLWGSCLFYINVWDSCLLWDSCLFYINVWDSSLFYINVWDSCLLWDSCLFYINVWDSCLFYINVWDSSLFYINVWDSSLFYINVWAVSFCSPLCYSSDRQLSLDLVNVGRQRLDFLPLLEHSGTYRETPTHTGTFAQEIITLVHHVKEQYFGGGGLTLNERFSAPQAAAFDEDEEAAMLTLNQRFSANQCPVRGPGDLRHDLERRRQERIEGVKVTIAGSGTSQRPLGPDSLRCRRNTGDKNSTWSELTLTSDPAPPQPRDLKLIVGLAPFCFRGQREGGPFKAFQRRNYGITNQFRRQKRYNFQGGRRHKTTG
uniref:Zgc:112982 n=1 Tax=Takifugu rubripes TaxID=31033 RepID=A0A674MYI5_TAKRU